MYRKTMRAALEEARQYKDPKTELMVSKEVDGKDKTIVIDKKDWPTYEAKGWKLAEEVKVNTDVDIIDLFEKYVELKEFTPAMMAKLKKEYEPLRGKTFTPGQIKKMNDMLSKFTPDLLMKLAQSDIPFLSTSAKSKLVIKHGKKWSDFKQPLDMAEAGQLDEAIQLNTVRGLTQRNDHFGARIYVAQQMRDKDMESIYQGLELLHRKYGSFVGNAAIQARDKIEKLLYGKIVGKWGTKAGDRIIKEL